MTDTPERTERALEILAKHGIIEGFSIPLEPGYIAVVDPDAVIAAMSEALAFARHRIAALAAPVDDGWRPIGEAPTDGTPILAFGPMPGLGWGDPHVRETKYEDYQEGSPGYDAYLTGKGPKGIGWRWYEPVHGWAQTWKPTHFRPLPAAPAITDGAGS